ncbi:hypothetical protein QBC46DRAFT_390976 [Diplogelasinospora grovesii]|uniref:Uncharacterized protein n=1 Tax=Diplogelasinospora grovesii TaxID=303347 RepID=A0AAN6S1W9_9PEZI|nr:hypothetical protein QBC46DRAFT_390976 [Diplogelasinospora grovesii]
MAQNNPLPDFDNTTVGFDIFTSEIPGLSNLAPVPLGNQTLARITAIQDRLTTIEGQLTAVKTEAENARIKVRNAHWYALNHRAVLEPLRDVGPRIRSEVWDVRPLRRQRSTSAIVSNFLA